MKVCRSLRFLVFSLLIFIEACSMPSSEDKLVESAGSGDLKEIQKFLSSGVSVNCRAHSLDRITPLIWAVMQRQEKSVTALLAAGADPNIRDAHKNTALFYAYSVQTDLSFFIKSLIASGANTQEYQAMFENLSQDNPNRIAFEQAINLQISTNNASVIMDAPVKVK
jgi:ankyrin repeat protein